MANINLYLPFLFKWEGGYVNDPMDLGGATNKGVTLKTWILFGYDKNKDGKIDKKDLQQLVNQDVVDRILKPHYWDRWQADLINSQKIAALLVDWVWNSGSPGIKIPQAVLGVKADGIVGEKTLQAINTHPDEKRLFLQLYEARMRYIDDICWTRPDNKRFEKGWKNRLYDIKQTFMLICPKGESRIIAHRIRGMHGITRINIL